MSNRVNAALARLRVELFTAAQLLDGDELREFWQLIDDVCAIRETTGKVCGLVYEWAPVSRSCVRPYGHRGSCSDVGP